MQMRTSIPILGVGARALVAPPAWRPGRSAMRLPVPAWLVRWVAGVWRPLPGLLALAVLLGLGGCATGLPINTQHVAQGQDSRAMFLILHYTDEDFASSLKILTQQQVSSHYLVSDEKPPVIYRLVDENRRAWHAGRSHWAGHTMLNAASIGIEIVNLGERAQPDGTRAFRPYPPEQIERVVALVKDIVARHQIRPDRVLAHSDIAPQRKVDPGPLFPWKRLADEGLIPWPEDARVAHWQAVHEQQPPTVDWWRRSLAAWGFEVLPGEGLDPPLRRVIAAFQMKYRPQRHDGLPDAETAARLQALLEQAAERSPRR